MAAIIRMDENETTRFDLVARVVLGRSRTSSIVLHDPRVSHTHAEICRLASGDYQLRNLSATNGTYVKGVSVSEVVLADGDPIILGATRFFFEADPMPEIAGPVRATLGAIPNAEVEAGARPPTRAYRETSSQPASFRPHQEITDVACLRRDYEKLRGAYEILRAVDDEVTLDGLLERIVELSTALFGADRAVIFLVDPHTGQPTPRMAKQRVGDPWELQISETVLREVSSKRQALVCQDVGLDCRFSGSDSIVSQGILSVMCVPLLHDDELLGMIYLDSRVATRVFGEVDLEVFAGIANQAAAAVHSATLKAHIRALEQQRIRAIRELISGASHFINNPLAVIRANLDLLTNWSEELVEFHREVSHQPEVAKAAERRQIAMIDEELGPMARESLVSAHRIAGIVHALRLFEQGDCATSTIDVGATLVACITRLESVTNPVARVHIRVPSGLTMRASPERLSQLLDALVLNSVQAITAGAPRDNWVILAAEAEAHGRHLLITVEDTGCGLPAGDEDKVFVPFYTTRSDGSLGLGLAVATEIVHQHGGTIKADSSERGGARFTIRLPLVASHRAHPSGFFALGQ